MATDPFEARRTGAHRLRVVTASIGAAAVVGTYDVKAQALIDLIRGRFQPRGKLVMSIPANQAAINNHAVDVPGYLEAFNYSYKNVAGDTYIFGFGKSSF